MTELLQVKSRSANWDLPPTPTTTTTLSNGDGPLPEAAEISETGKPFVVPTTSVTLAVDAINLSWDNVSFTAKDGKQILNQLSGNACSGELLAIMGPSGSGKTTLLNVLSGFTPVMDPGKVLVNGNERNVDSFKKISCYIMQDEQFLEHFTLRETMDFVASVKIPISVPKTERDREVDDAISTLGLTEVQHTKVLLLSGGERRRLGIAQQLVSNPQVMFLDEPTSGLDSSSCLQCVKFLLSLARKGRTIVCTIHQPSTKIFELFDKLYMLADGRCLYRGTTNDLVPFLASQDFHCPQYHNPADFITEIASGEIENGKSSLAPLFQTLEDESKDQNGSTGNGLNNLVAANKSTLCLIEDVNGKPKASRKHDEYATSAFHQYKMIFHRSVMYNFKNPILSYIRLGVQIVSGLFFGLLFLGVGDDASRIHENSVYLAMCLMFQNFDAMMVTVMIFPTEKNVVIREHLNNWYSIMMYYLGRTTATIPFQIVFPIIFASISYWMTGQSNDLFRFGIFAAILVISPLCGESIAILTGACASPQVAAYVTPIVMIPFFLFSGNFVSTETITPYMSWLTYCSYMRYGYHSLGLAAYGFDRAPLQCDKEFCPFADPKEYMKSTGIDSFSLKVNIAIQFAFIILFRVIAFFVLRYKLKYSRDRK